MFEEYARRYSPEHRLKCAAMVPGKLEAGQDDEPVGRTRCRYPFDRRIRRTCEGFYA